MDTSTELQALNGSKLPSFGKQEVKIRLNKKVFVHTMTLASIKSPILGWDFLQSNRFDILWTNNKCVLFCNKSKTSYPLHMGKASTAVLNLAPVSAQASLDRGSHEVSFKKY